nr:putative ribonuclease H-like domain-containing protein [Tanacetum cinerariifolium]
NNDGDVAFDGKEPDFDAKKPESEVNFSPSSSAQSRKQDDKTKKEAKSKKKAGEESDQKYVLFPAWFLVLQTLRTLIEMLPLMEMSLSLMQRSLSLKSMFLQAVVLSQRNKMTRPRERLKARVHLKVKVIRSDNGTELKNNELSQFCGMKEIKRSDNGTELKNNELSQFCGMKEIKREFSVPRTPQQNGIAKEKNRTPIEAARTTLADSLLPIPF